MKIGGSEDAYESGNTKFRTLEEYMMRTDREGEDEVRSTYRMPVWQNEALKTLEDRMGTRISFVCNRAYNYGLTILRSNLRGFVKETAALRNQFVDVAGNMRRGNDRFGEALGRLDDISIDIRHRFDYDTISSGVSAPLKASVYSEVRSEYVRQAFLGDWVHKYIIAIAMIESETIPTYITQKAKRVLDVLLDEAKKCRVEVEEVIYDFVNASMVSWMQEGIYERSYEGFVEIVGEMKTDRAEEVMGMLDMLDGGHIK